MPIEGYSNVTHPTRPPAVLRRRTFYAFATAYEICIILLVVILAIDGTNQGLVTINHNVHYAWTYGPTLRKLFQTKH